MIKSLTLTNFKKHTSLRLDFVEGLNLLQAPNECGKSSTLEAINYALYGARALKSSFAETVTDGQPESTLKVELVFDHAGIEYKIIRGKSGASMVGGGSISEGQAEVTITVERFFGCDATTASQLMFAAQADLRGALEAGPTAAVALIETLADLSTLDNLIQKMQDQLPSGNTKLLEAQILELSTVEKPVADFSELSREVIVLEAVESVTRGLVVAPTHNLKALHTEAASADALLKKLHKDSLQVSSLNVAASQVPTQNPDVAALEALAAAQAQDKTVQADWNRFQSLPEQAETSEVDFTGRMKFLKEQIADLKCDATQYQKALTVAELGIIEGDCKLCGRLTSEISEVVSINEQARLAIADAANKLEATARALGSAKDELAEMESTERLMQKRALLAQGLQVTTTGFPPQYVWAGPTISSEIDTTDYVAALKSARATVAANRTLLASIEAAKQQLVALQPETLLARIAQADVVVNFTQQALTQAAAKEQAFKDAQKAHLQANQDLAQAVRKLEQAQALHTFNLQAFEMTQDNLKQAQQALLTYGKNNNLIKKLKEARPVVAKQLWGTVLGAISHHFSLIRGVPSLVARGDGGFTVDGKPVKRLSGSTLDALGLAIRVALVKTFLPSCGFLILDEPGAACDDERELAMVGLIAGCGFNQTIMVSHSDAATGFASKVLEV